MLNPPSFIPHYFKHFNPPHASDSLAHVGGAEVLPAGFGSSEALAPVWIASTRFADCSGDAYVRPRLPHSLR